LGPLRAPSAILTRSRAPGVRKRVLEGSAKTMAVG
jgi:hypothetical protein